MKAIWKEQIRITDEQELIVPKGSKILCVQIQNGAPCLYLWYRASG